MSIYRVHKNMYNILTRSNKASNKTTQHTSNRVARKALTNLKQYTCEPIATVKVIVRKIL
jgi:hypothetical protein